MRLHLLFAPGRPIRDPKYKAAIRDTAEKLRAELKMVRRPWWIRVFG